jgi:uncharacterized lipoprotein YajG
MNRLLLIIVSVLLLAGCGGGSLEAAPATASKLEKSCTLETKEDLIERHVDPESPAWAVLVGDMNLAACKKTVDSLVVTPGAGYCVQVARAADNPGYNVDAQPAARLRKVIASVGEGCQ